MKIKYELWNVQYVHMYLGFLDHVLHMRIKLQNHCDRKEVGNLQEYCDKTSKKLLNSTFDDICFTFD